MDKLRVGLIGLGGVAEAHLEGYKQVESIEVVAGAEIQAERLAKMSKKWQLKAYADYRELLAQERLDIACVLTPARFHREVTEKVAEAGVHVLCEKPLAVTLDDGRAMIAACEKKGVRLCYGATWRFLPACRKARPRRVRCRPCACRLATRCSRTCLTRPSVCWSAPWGSSRGTRKAASFYRNA